MSPLCNPLPLFPAGIIKEVAIMRMLQGHPHVVQLLDVYEDEQYYHLVMELCSGGELFDRIISRGHFSERDAAVIMRSLLDFISFAHSKHIVHRWVGVPAEDPCLV
jgi:calcium-dependent protein kinase